MPMNCQGKGLGLLCEEERDYLKTTRTGEHYCFLLEQIK